MKAFEDEFGNALAEPIQRPIVGRVFERENQYGLRSRSYLPGAEQDESYIYKDAPHAPIILRCVRLLLLKLFGDILYFRPDAKQVAAPKFADLLLGVAAPDQFKRHVKCLGGAIPSVDAAAAVKV